MKWFAILLGMLIFEPCLFSISAYYRENTVHEMIQGEGIFFMHFSGPFFHDAQNEKALSKKKEFCIFVHHSCLVTRLIIAHIAYKRLHFHNKSAAFSIHAILGHDLFHI